MKTPLPERIRRFLAAGPWVVVGASSDRSKYGNKVLRCYQQHGREPLYAVNPREQEIEGLRAYPNLAALPEPAGPQSIAGLASSSRICEAIIRRADPNGGASQNEVAWRISLNG